jgi:hypothetical protein
MRGAPSVMKVLKDSSLSSTASDCVHYYADMRANTVAHDGWNTRAQPRVRRRLNMRARSRNRLQNRAAHEHQRIVARQIARKPQPPVQLLIVQFS